MPYNTALFHLKNSTLMTIHINSSFTQTHMKWPFWVFSSQDALLDFICSLPHHNSTASTILKLKIWTIGFGGKFVIKKRSLTTIYLSFKIPIFIVSQLFMVNFSSALWYVLIVSSSLFVCLFFPQRDYLCCVL